jgi:glycosyltransferase involved in cell wall biosynthesis
MNKKNKKFDIAICLPSINEEKTIAQVTSIVSKGLQLYFPNYKAIIINVDNNSTDNTKENFLKTKTLGVEKLHLSTKHPGKGRNILTFVNYVIEEDIPYLATIDTDLTSIKPMWIKEILTPLIQEGFDFVSPVYKRNRYEGNTTNHLCFPILYTLFGDTIRQPIAGDFGFSLNLAKHLKNIQKHPSVEQYGIDITITLTAFLNGLKIKEVYLGEKVHNPSFQKMIPIFLGEVQSLIFLITNYTNYLNKKKITIVHAEKAANQAIMQESFHPKQENINKRKEEVYHLYQTVHIKYLTKYKKCIKRKISSKIWSRILKDFLNQITNKKLDNTEIKNISYELLIFYLIRVLSYFEEIESLDNKQIEELLRQQSINLSKIY